LDRTPEFRIAENQKQKIPEKRKQRGQAYFMDGQRFFRRSPVGQKSGEDDENAGEVMIKFAFFLVSEKSGLCLGIRSVIHGHGHGRVIVVVRRTLARKKPRERRRKKLDEAATTKRNAELGKHADM